MHHSHRRTWPWIRGRSRASIVGISRIQFSADDKLEFMKWAWKEQREVLRGWNLAREVHTLSFSFSPSSPPRIKKHPSPSQTGTNSFFLLFFTRCRLVSIMEIVHFHEIVLCPIYIYNILAQTIVIMLYYKREKSNEILEHVSEYYFRELFFKMHLSEIVLILVFLINRYYVWE